MSKLSKRIIAIAVVVLIIAGITVSTIINKRSLDIPEGTIGATAGNLNNYGLFCELEGRVYFANSYDQGTLYSMNSDQTDIKKVYNLAAKYINAANNRIFFYGGLLPGNGVGDLIGKPGIYMIKNNGSKLNVLTNDTSQSMVLYGDNLYYQHYTKEGGATLYSVNIKSEENKPLLDYMVNPACVYGGKIYYNGMYDDHYLRTYDTNTGESAVVWTGDIWNPIREGQYIYYMDIQHNYRLCRYSLTEDTIEVLTEDRLDFFNVYNDIIFYQKSSSTEPALIRINLDGSNPEIMARGVYNSINITSTYTYFKEFGNDFTTYYVSTYGYGGINEFSAAKEAAIKNTK